MRLQTLRVHVQANPFFQFLPQDVAAPLKGVALLHGGLPSKFVGVLHSATLTDMCALAAAVRMILLEAVPKAITA